MIHVFDTSVWIEAWWRHYRIGRFPTLWQDLASFIDEGRVISPMEVLKEIEKQEDDLFKWLKQRQQVFREVDVRTEDMVREIMKSHPRLVDINRDRSGADPWVIALAVVETAVVVTYENRGKKALPKIPDVCEHYGTGCVSMADFLDAQPRKY